MIILQDSIQLQQNQEIKISDTISYLNTNAEQPFSDRPIFRPEILPGNDFKDKVTGVPAVCSTPGTRYGIVNNIVTQFSVNQPPIEDDGLRGCPAFTQFCTYTESLTTNWTPVNIAVVNNGLFQNQALNSLIENTSVNVIHGLTRPAFTAPDDSVIGLRFVCGAIGSRMLQLKALLKTNSWVVLCRVNFASGTIININAATIATAITPLGQGLYDVFVAYRVGTGGTSPRTSPELYNGTSEIYTGDGVSGVYFCQPTYINFGVNAVPYVPPYIPNNTSGSISVVTEAATSTTGTSFDLDDVKLSRLKTALRGPNAQGHLELTFKSNVNSGQFPYASNNFDFGLLTNNDAIIGILFFRKAIVTGLNLFIFRASATEYAEVSVNDFSPGQIFKISLDWGPHSTSSKMRLTVNGVKSSLANFSGSFGTQDLRFFFGNTVHAGWIVKDSFKIMDRPQW